MMSAIAGLVDLRCDEQICQGMINTMLRRGPDSEAVYKDERCVLVYRKMSTQSKHAPAQINRFDWVGDKWAVINESEVNNINEMRNRMICLGHSFTSNEDAEVIVHGYAQWGKGFIDMLQGLVCFVLWNITKNTLLVVRDRMGIKPLFYMPHGSGLIFSSEIKTILAYPTVKAELDCTGAAQLILLGPGRIPGSGVLKNIYELEPGGYLEYDAHKLFCGKYWDLKDREHTESFDQTAEHVRWLVLDAIKGHIDVDANLGAFLSGGLDSSIICSVCAEELKKSGKVLNTFSVDYVDHEKFFVAGKYQPESDKQYIQIMRDHLGSTHHWTILDPYDLINCLEDATIARDLPGMADVDFSLLALCNQVKNTVGVALSGECADELFGGYPWFRDVKLRTSAGFPWAANIRYREGLLSERMKEQIDAESFVMDHFNSSIQKCDILPGGDAVDAEVKKMSYLNQKWFMQTLMDRNDRMSMYNGLEVRAPFCDHRIASYMYGVPWKFMEFNGREKGLLRYAMKGLLPDKVLWRKKSPYPKTFDPTYHKLVKQMLKDVICDVNQPVFQIVSRTAAIKLLDEEMNDPFYGRLMKSPQTIAYLLQINYWLKAYHVTIV